MQVTIRKFYYIKLAMTLSKHFCNTLKQMPCSARVEKIPCSSLAAFMALALKLKSLNSLYLSPWVFSLQPFWFSLPPQQVGGNEQLGLNQTQSHDLRGWWNLVGQVTPADHGCSRLFQEGQCQGAVRGVLPWDLELHRITVGFPWTVLSSLGSPSPRYVARSQWQDRSEVTLESLPL